MDVSRRVVSVLVCLALASMIHLDWHLARPAVHHLSLGLAWHWTLAIPTFGLVGWYVARVSGPNLFRMSLSVLACAFVIAGVLEPAWEYALGDATLEWAFGRARLAAFASFVGTGIVAYAATVWFLRRGNTPQRVL